MSSRQRRARKHVYYGRALTTRFTGRTRSPKAYRNPFYAFKVFNRNWLWGGRRRTRVWWKG